MFPDIWDSFTCPFAVISKYAVTLSRRITHLERDIVGNNSGKDSLKLKSNASDVLIPSELEINIIFVLPIFLIIAPYVVFIVAVKAELFPSSDCNIVQCNRYGIGIDFGQHNFPGPLSGSAYDITNKDVCGIFHAYHNSGEI